jgi:hypothetical protein
VWLAMAKGAGRWGRRLGGTLSSMEARAFRAVSRRCPGSGGTGGLGPWIQHVGCRHQLKKGACRVGPSGQREREAVRRAWLAARKRDW